eukprot:7388234-Prymnesium_polylepis.1
MVRCGVRVSACHGSHPKFVLFSSRVARMSVCACSGLPLRLLIRLSYVCMAGNTFVIVCGHRLRLRLSRLRAPARASPVRAVRRRAPKRK